MTSLETRMAMTVVGQVTWAEPEVGEKCASCAYWGLKKVRKDGVKLGVCAMVRVYSKLNMVPFVGEAAIACPKFLARPAVGGEA